MNVLIIDDDPKRARNWAENIAAHAPKELTVWSQEADELTETVTTLRKRLRLARVGGDWRSIRSGLDDVDILLVDFDLLELTSVEFASGEEIAYLSRMLSNAKVICVINQFGPNRFDLSMRSDINRKNDLDIGSDQIPNCGLWQPREKWFGYRPWHWPILPHQALGYDKRLEDILKNPSAGILEFLGLNTKNSNRALPREILSFFQVESDQFTFDKIFTGSRAPFVHPRDQKWLAADKEQSARVLAAMIYKWLDRLVLARQDILIDLPHLAAAKPWLLKDPTTLKGWNHAAELHANSAFRVDLSKFRFELSHWLSRDAFWLREINEEDGLAFPPDEWNGENSIDCVFREDTSDFGLREESDDFVSELGTANDLRYIAGAKKIQGATNELDPSRVDYTPAIRLAM